MGCPRQGVSDAAAMVAPHVTCDAADNIAARVTLSVLQGELATSVEGVMLMDLGGVLHKLGDLVLANHVVQPSDIMMLQQPSQGKFPL